MTASLQLKFVEMVELTNTNPHEEKTAEEFARQILAEIRQAIADKSEDFIDRMEEDYRGLKIESRPAYKHGCTLGLQSLDFANEDGKALAAELNKLAIKIEANAATEVYKEKRFSVRAAKPTINL